jgi:rubrerythrin
MMNGNLKQKDSGKLDKLLAQVCVMCPVCRRARKKQTGMAFDFVRKVEDKVCPFCAAYYRIYGKKSHEP